MRIQTNYIADDGTIFDSEAACIRYEDKKRAQENEELAILNKFCKFFDDKGNRIYLDEKFNESPIYAVTIDCAFADVQSIMDIFGNHFDELYFALEASNFQSDYKTILVYDWTNDNNGWKEIDCEQRDYLEFIKKVMGWG